MVASRKKESILALVDSNQDGRVDKCYVVANELDNYEAIAFYKGDIYSEVKDILKQ